MVTCVEDFHYQTYYHFTLIPSCVFLLSHHILDFYYTRRFHLIPPFQYLMDNDCKRIYYVFTFGALGNTFLWDSHGNEMIEFNGSDIWCLKPISSFLLVIEIGFIYYPIFACFCSRYILFSRFFGSIHVALIIIQQSYRVLRETCGEDDWLAGEDILRAIPGLCCLFIVLLCFVKDLVVCIKNCRSTESFEKEVVNNRQVEYVKKLFKKSISLTPSARRNSMVSTVLKHIWRNDANFRYSSIVLGSVLITYIFYFSLLIWAFEISKTALEKPSNYTMLIKEITKMDEDVVYELVSASLIFTLILSIAQSLRFLVSHRKNLKRMYKSKEYFLEYSRMTDKNVFQACSYFCGYFIAYNIFGPILFSIITVTLALLIYLMILFHEFFIMILKFVYQKGFVAFLFFMLQWALMKFVFMEKKQKSNKQSNNYWIRNLKMYHIMIYFTIFGNLLFGIFTSLFTSIAVFFINIASLGRIDYSVMNSKYFLRIDRGHRAYLAFLRVQSIYTNPTVKCFCQILLETDVNRVTRKFTYNAARLSVKACNRWHLAVMLTKNPCLRKFRCKVADLYSGSAISDEENDAMLETAQLII